MGRVKDNITINNQDFWTLFDSGSLNCYVLSEVTSGFPKLVLPIPFRVALGGSKHEFKEQVLLYATIQNKPVHIEAYIIDHLGKDERGNEIKILFGALAMQKWGIELNLTQEKVDLSHYPNEYIEFFIKTF